MKTKDLNAIQTIHPNDDLIQVKEPSTPDGITPNDKINVKLEVYLRVIDYKRSIGQTQWTVFSLFVTASGAIFAYGLTQTGTSNKYLPIFALMIYWLGFLFYKTYRNLNRNVSDFLVIMENELGVAFQKHLDEYFHSKSVFSTEDMLCVAGLVYTCFALIIIIL